MKIILFIWFTDKIKKIQTETKLSPKSPKPQARNWGIGYIFLDPWGMTNYHSPIPQGMTIAKELASLCVIDRTLSYRASSVHRKTSWDLLKPVWNLFEPVETSQIPIFLRCYQKSGYWEVSRGFKRFFGKQEWHCEINQTLSYNAKVSWILCILKV